MLGESFNQEKVLAEVATNVLEKTFLTTWKKVSKFFKDLSAQESIDYGTAYEEYLKNTQNKYSKIKTLIYRHAPQPLYSFYECIGVTFEDQTINTDNISNLLDVSNKIIITGTGGIGKSILFKHLYLNTIDSLEYIPVLIELRSFNTLDNKEISLKKAIFDNLSQYGFTLEEEYFDYSLTQGGYVILLDGFDELNRDKRDIVSQSIKNFCSQYPDNNYIISSRPSDMFIGWNDFCEMSAMKLNKEQALSLINKIDFDPKVKDIFYKELDNVLYEKYESFASNPLLLTIMLLTFSDNASIPDNLNDFYEEAFSTLFNMHDATKDSYVRDIRSGLGCEDFKHIFSYVCFKSYFRDEYEFTEFRLRQYIYDAKEKFPQIAFSVDDFQEDLISSVCMIVKDGINYKFTHRTFQEYFAALYTCKLTDDIQAKVLINWIKESPASENDMYFKMLYNMQSDKVNKIILLPGMKELEQLYNDNSFSINFLEILFDGVQITKDYDTNEQYLSLIRKDGYHCRVLSLIRSLNELDRVENYYDIQQKVIQQLISAGIEEKKIVPFSLVIDITGEELLLSAVKWYEDRILSAIKSMDQYTNNPVLKKKKLSSIIDEL